MEFLYAFHKYVFSSGKTLLGLDLIVLVKEFGLYLQFGGLGSLEQHGFARNRIWAVDTDPPPFPVPTSSRAYVDLILKPSEEDMKIWPHR